MLSPTELSLMVLTVILFAVILTDRLPIEIVALTLLLVLTFTELVPADEALSGFSSSVVITLLGLFVITRALEETGVIHRIADRLNRMGAGSEVRLITIFMIAGATLSLIMNNVAAGAVLLPAALRVAHISGVRPSKLLMPLSFGTLVGGMTTYLTTANILMSTLLQENGLQGLTMLDFIPTGGIITIAGVLYMTLIGRHLLPDHGSLTQRVLPDLSETYQLQERTWEVQVLDGSRLVASTLRHSEISATLGLTVLAIWRNGQAIFTPQPETVIRPRDVLLVLGRQERVETLLTWGTQLRQTNIPPTLDRTVILAEAIVPPRSGAVGQSLQALKFRDKFGATVVAIWRGGHSYRTDVGKMPLSVGDALLVVGDAAHVNRVAADPDFLMPLQETATRPTRPEKAAWAIAITAVVLALAIFELFPIGPVMLAGAVAMVLSDSLSLEGFYDAIEWKVIFLVAGMLPLSIAISDSGLADRAGRAMVALLATQHPIWLIVGIFLMTVFVAQIIGGQVAALVIGPIAISAALQLDISPQATSVTVAIGCSTAFLTPFAHPVNIIMMGPGGYQLSDFLRVGIGMTLVTLMMLVVGMVVFWGI